MSDNFYSSSYNYTFEAPRTFFGEKANSVDSQSSAGLIAGLIAGILGLTALCTALLIWWYKKRGAAMASAHRPPTTNPGCEVPTKQTSAAPIIHVVVVSPNGELCLGDEQTPPLPAVTPANEQADVRKIMPSRGSN